MPIKTFRDVLAAAGPLPPITAVREEKKNYAEQFSKHTATYIANALRKTFKTILPREDGTGQESRARTSRGSKKLDVNYSTPDMGLALGISVKSMHHPDPKNGRFTKNYSRNDNELRAEAVDYHRRQPFSVLVGVLFLPISCCDDVLPAEDRPSKASSFGAAVKYFRRRAGRLTPAEDPDLFERFFIALYDRESGTERYFDVMSAPPRIRRPRTDETLSFSGFIGEAKRTFARRNRLDFTWAD